MNTQLTYQQAMVIRRRTLATPAKGRGYWALETETLLRAHPRHYKVEIGSLPHPSHLAPGVIYIRPATSGKWAKSRATRLGAPLCSRAEIVAEEKAARSSARRIKQQRKHRAEAVAAARAALRRYLRGNSAYRLVRTAAVHGGARTLAIREIATGEEYHLSDFNFIFETHTGIQSPLYPNGYGVAASRTPAGIVANAAEAFSERRKAAQARAAHEAMQRDLDTTRVTLADSRRAGNCVEGALQFVERKLRITRDEILAGGYLFALPARLLQRVANGDAPAVERAIRVAYERETMVSI